MQHDTQAQEAFTSCAHSFLQGGRQKNTMVAKGCVDKVGNDLVNFESEEVLRRDLAATPSLARKIFALRNEQ